VQPLTKIKSSFAGGEIAPSLYSRIDLAKYSIGAKTLRNFIVHPTGGISNRPGLEYIATGKTSAKKIRLIPFEFSTTQTYVLEFGDYYVRTYSAGVQGWDNYIKLLLHCNGTDGTTTFTDETGTHTVTAVGDAELDTAQKKFGTASGLFSGAGSLTIPSSSDFAMGTSDFTIEFWVRLNTINANNTFIASSTGDNLNIRYYDTGNTLNVYLSTVTYTFSWTPVADTWYHVSVTRSGTNLRAFIDGVQIGTTQTSTDNIVATGLIIGTSHNATGPLDGWLDEIEISKGIARRTANFSVPIEERAFPVDVVTPYSEDDIFDLNYTQSADVLYLTHPDYAPRQFERLSATSWQIVSYAYENGPFQLANIDTSKTIAVSAVSGDDKTLTAVGFTFDDEQVGALFKLRHYIEGQAKTQDIDEVEATSSIACGGTWRLITHGTWTATIQVQKSTDGGSTWTSLREFSSADDNNIDTSGVEDMSDYGEPFLVRINCSAYTSGPCNINLTTDPFYHEGIVEVSAVAANGETATVDVLRNCGLTTATIDWSESSWSDYRGWPAQVEFHPEDRLVFANTPTEPYTYWMTRTGSYTDFSVSSPLQDDDAISSPVPARKVNGINGLIPLSELVALTLSNEISIRSGSGPLSPTTTINKINGWEGSYGIKPLIVGNRAIYVQSIGSIIRDLGYSIYSETFEGEDLTPFSNHLFTGYTFVDMAYQQNPDRLVWAVRSDGKLLSMTYMREQEVVAWSWHDTNDGDDLFESVCSIRGTGYDEVWFIVNRNGTRYIERLKQRMVSTALEDQFFVDCGDTYDNVPTTTITATHLNGKTVSILADGVVLDQQVVTANTITLATAASVVQYGLPYNADVETLNVEAELNDGTIQGKKVHISNVILRLLNTQGGYIGPDSDNLLALGLDSRADYDTEALYSGDHSVSLGAGYKEGGRFFYRQSDPLPVTITGLVPKITVGGHTNVR
jgi:hypothetical protein